MNFCMCVLFYLYRKSWKQKVLSNYNPHRRARKREHLRSATHKHPVLIIITHKTSTGLLQPNCNFEESRVSADLRSKCYGTHRYVYHIITYHTAENLHWTKISPTTAVNFRPRGKDRHRLYVTINIGQKICRIKILPMKARDEKDEIFLQAKISGCIMV